MMHRHSFLCHHIQYLWRLVSVTSGSRFLWKGIYRVFKLILLYDKLRKRIESKGFSAPLKAFQCMQGAQTYSMHPRTPL